MQSTEVSSAVSPLRLPPVRSLIQTPLIDVSIPRLDDRVGIAQAAAMLLSALLSNSFSKKRRSYSGDPMRSPPPPRPPRPAVLFRSDTGDIGQRPSPPSNTAQPRAASPSQRPKKGELVPMSSHQRSLRLQGLPLVRPEPVAPPSGSLSAEDLAKKTRHNDDLVKEILATERSYVSDIAAVIKASRKDLLTPHERLTIFSNLESILPLNEQLLVSLEAEAAKPLAERRIGGNFLKLVEYLKMYQIYCGNQGEALALLAKLKKRRKDWVSFCESVRQLPEFRKLGLEDMLIKPMQRLCRYPLLLSELIKCTPEGHPDREKQLAAKERLDQVIQIANEARRQFDATTTLHKLHKHLTLTSDPSFVLIIPARYLVKRATLKVWSHKVAAKEKMSSSSKRELLLFNDTIVVCEIRDKKLIERAIYPVREVIAWELQYQKFPHSFGVVRTDEPDTMSFACETAEDCQEWIKVVLSTAAEERARRAMQ